MKIMGNRLVQITLALTLSVGMVATLAPAGCNRKGGGEAGTEASANNDGEQTPVMEATGPVARVNGEDVKVEVFNKLANRHLGYLPVAAPAEVLEQFKDRLINMAVEEHLLDRLVEQEEVEISQSDIEEQFNEFRESFPDADTFASFMEDNQIDEDIIKNDIRKSLTIKDVITRDHQVDTSEEELQRRYAASPQRYQVQEEARASHILLRVAQDADEEATSETLEKARKLVEQAREPGADFAALAQAESDCPSSAQGGDLNYFDRGRMVPEFAQAAFSMEEGEISDPVRTTFGYHIIKKTGHRSARTIPFEEVKEQIEQEIEEGHMQQAFAKMMEEIREGAEIERLPENIRVNAETEETD